MLALTGFKCALHVDAYLPSWYSVFSRVQVLRSPMARQRSWWHHMRLFSTSQTRRMSMN